MRCRLDLYNVCTDDILKIVSVAGLGRIAIDLHRDCMGVKSAEDYRERKFRVESLLGPWLVAAIFRSGGGISPPAMHGHSDPYLAPTMHVISTLGSTQACPHPTVSH